MKATKKKHNILFLLFIVQLIPLLNSCAKPLVQQEERLLTLDARKLGSGSMDIIIRETDFQDNIATIDHEIIQRGSAGGSSIFSMCSYTLFARKRGYSYYVIFSDKPTSSCSNCEWSSTSSVGYLKNAKPQFVTNIVMKDDVDINEKELSAYLSDQFPGYDLENLKELKIYRVSDFMIVCKDLEDMCSW